MSSAKPDALLSARIDHRIGALALDIDFTLTQPWTVLFGPSGSGKTSALRTIAGFERPDSGRITYREQTLVDIGAGVFVPPHIRLVRTATQSARLFPHMTVAENIGYGVSLRSKPHDRRDLDIDINDRRDFIAEVLKLFRVAALAQRLPRELSGGEAQRVSLARAAASAVASAPDRALLLLDEPFGGMDVALRDEILLELKVWLSKWNTPVLSVTHDLGEAFLLDAEVIKIADGRVVAQGPVAEVLAEERRRLIEQLQGD